MSSNPLCSEDETSPAVYCCFCRFPLPTICAEHIYKHPMDTDFLQHFHLPLEARQWIASRELRDQCMPWLFKLHSAVSALRRNLDAISVFETELKAIQLEILHEVELQFSELNARLVSLRHAFTSQMETAIGLTTTHALEQGWRPEDGSLAQLIWSFDPSTPTTMTLFRFSAAKGNLACLPQSIISAMARSLAEIEQCAKVTKGMDRSQDSGPILPIVFETALKLFDCVTGLTTSALLLRSFTSSTVFCRIDDDSLMCVGDDPETQAVYLVRMSTATITELPNTVKKRNCSGIIKCGGFVYVFGGGEDRKSCEKYAILARSWVLLASMSLSRQGFSPCYFEGDIYLPEFSWSNGPMEKFNINTEHFTNLSVRLGLLTNGSVSFVADGELIVITQNGQIGKWMINREDGFRVAQVTLPLEGCTVSSIPPVKIDRIIVFVERASGSLLRFDLDAQIVTA